MNTPLRILAVLPMYGGSLPVGRYCVQALRRMGHGVDVFEAPGFYSAFNALKEQRISTQRLAALENGFLQLVAQTILAKVESLEPDLVLALAQAPLSRSALRRLRQDKVPTAMWFVEDHQVFPYWKAYAPLYDFFAVIQKEPFLGLLREAGQDNALYLPMAATPEVHRPLELSAVQARRYGADVSFLGAGYPNRLTAFRQLLSLDFKIWGNDWPERGSLTSCMARPGQRIDTDEAVRIFNATRINLNLHSAVKSEPVVTHGDFVNPRTFELASCQAFQLVDRRSLLAELFTDREVAVFDDMQGLHEALGHYLTRPEERAAMSRLARERVVCEHTYVHRMQTLLDFIQQRRHLGRHLGRHEPGDHPGQILAGLDSDLRQEVEVLLQTLNLPASVSFADLIQVIRQQNGVLSPVETSLLFLDEWRKQYVR
jgi:spore maturation protein CgeB